MIVTPDFHVPRESGKPHIIIVGKNGRRIGNEAGAYMESVRGCSLPGMFSHTQYSTAEHSRITPVDPRKMLNWGEVASLVPRDHPPGRGYRPILEADAQSIHHGDGDAALLDHHYE
jgi:hypothetical protein